MAPTDTANRIKLTEKDIPKLPLPEGKAQEIYWCADTRGFGVVVGKKKRTYLYKTRVFGKQKKFAIGGHGEPMPEGHACGPVCQRAKHCWNLALARVRVADIKREIKLGHDPGAKAVADKGSATVRAALALHVNKRRGRDGRPSAIDTIDREVQRYLAKWLDRRLISITRLECSTRHQEIRDNHGPHVADRVMRHLRAIFRTAEGLAAKSDPLYREKPPTESLEWFTAKKGKVKARRAEPMSWEDLPAWYQRISTTDLVGNSCLLLIFLTGLRKMDAATVRWEHVDFKARTLSRPSPKGGKDKAFTIPLSGEAIKVLKARQLANKTLFGDDRGWAFPAVADKSDSEKAERHKCYLCPELGQPPHQRGVLTHIGDPRTQVYEEGKKTRDKVSAHRLRDTYITAANEAGGLSVFDIKALVNHAQDANDVTANYMDISDEHLARCQEAVTKLLMSKAKPKKKKGKKQ